MGQQLKERGASPIIFLLLILAVIGVTVGGVQLSRHMKPRTAPPPTLADRRISLGTFSLSNLMHYQAGVVIVQFKERYNLASLGKKPTFRTLINQTGAPLPASLATILADAQATNAKPLYPSTVTSPRLANTYSIEVPKETNIRALDQKLRQDSHVAFAEPNFIMTTQVSPNDPQFSSQWGPQKVNAPKAWDTGTGASSVVVAVIDSGIQKDHPDLASSVVAGSNFLGGDDTDGNGHGTHVAGIIGAIGNNTTGIAGMNWKVSLMPLKVCDSSGSCPDSATAEAITYAADHGAKVINMSLGGESIEPPTVMAQAVAYAIDKGVIVIAAAGNSGGPDAGQMYPGSLPGVIEVAATDTSDAKASFSTYGDRVDIAAPGVNILSTVALGSTLGGRCPGAQYCALSGTSQATPHVAGLAALLLSIKSSLTASQVRDIILATAQDLGTPGKDAFYGAGRIDAEKAVAMATSGILPSPQPTTTPMPTATPSHTPVPSSSSTPGPTSSPGSSTPTPTPIPTAVATPHPTPVPTSVPATPAPTASPTPTPKVTPTPSPTATGYAGNLCSQGSQFICCNDVRYEGEWITCGQQFTISCSVLTGPQYCPADNAQSGANAYCQQQYQTAYAVNVECGRGAAMDFIRTALK